MFPLSRRCRLPCLWILLWVITGLAAAVNAGAAALPGDLEPGGSGKVVEVIDGDTVALEDGRLVRLVGIQAPKLPLGRVGFAAWPLSDRARTELEALALGRIVELGYGGARLDRHGRALAHLVTAPSSSSSTGPDSSTGHGTGQWLQGEMLRQGLARTYSFADNRALVSEMLRLENDARNAGLGIWSHPYYSVRRTNWLLGDIGSFQLVIGRVLESTTVRGRVYLNFGADWKTDFTVTLEPKVRRLFESEGNDLQTYQGRDVRVRGWLKSYNGPMIEATHPEQIELLP